MFAESPLATHYYTRGSGDFVTLITAPIAHLREPQLLGMFPTH